MRKIKVCEDDKAYLKEKYDIGKRPLSLLLGWGEGTLTRYLNGDVPTKQYSDTLKTILLVSCSDITPLALQKLLYYAQSFFKAFTGEYLFHNNCEAWVHGPVYRSVYYKYKNHGYNPIEENECDYTDIELAKIEKEILDSVIRNFGCYSGKVLEKMTHSEMPWIITRVGLRDDESSDRIIEKELITKYFEDIKLKHNMLNISDISDYSTDLFNKLY